MLTRTIQIWPDRDDVTLTTYILDNSPEFKTGQRRPAILILPGGGYLGLSDREGEPIALRFAAAGYHAFVLCYATYYTSHLHAPAEKTTRNSHPSCLPQPIYDAAAAIRLIRMQADEWLVKGDQITVCGFSAGGHLAASLGTMWHQDFLVEKLGGPAADFRPDALVLAYPLIDFVLTSRIQSAIPDNPEADFLNLCEVAAFGRFTLTDVEKDQFNPVNHVSTRTPPAFIWHTATDALVPVENSLTLAAALQAAHVPLELHIFARGQHGLALANEITAASPEQISAPVQVWIDLALSWLENQFRFRS